MIVLWDAGTACPSRVPGSSPVSSYRQNRSHVNYHHFITIQNDSSYSPTTMIWTKTSQNLVRYIWQWKSCYIITTLLKFNLSNSLSPWLMIRIKNIRIKPYYHHPTTIQQLKLWVWTPLMTRCTPYNIMWLRLSVVCPWSVVLSGFLHHSNWSPWYSWNIVESGVKHQKTPFIYKVFTCKPV